ncbi:hypothetical protein [Microbacterium aurum]|uniref:hypothetical protein n=1 Tax=Microbacterium aurum TaxID=36805 RepID=UPI0012F4D9FA|nr:hypothetical protein [Microbacterium aurum]MBM7827699.1 hypothetical protein [Microbacterium aurum]
MDEIATLPGDPEMTAIEVDASGALCVATDETVTELTEKGEIASTTRLRSAGAVFAASKAGSLARVIPVEEDASVVRVAGGSAEARRILEQNTVCNVGLRIVAGADISRLAGLCDPAGLAWLIENELIVSVGDESGADLARLTIPVG